MRVLIIKTSSLGDIIHALPVLDFLHKASPGIEIGWAVEEQFCDLLEGNPLICRLHTIRTRKWRKRPFSSETRSEVVRLRHELSHPPYDIVFDLQGNLKSGLIGLLSGVKRRIGFPIQRLQEKINALFTTEKAPFSELNNHAALRCLNIVNVPFGISYREITFVSDIYTSPEDRASIATIIENLPYGPKLLFHCGTTWQTKFWHTEGWCELGRLLLKRYPQATILFTWGNEREKEEAEAIATCMGEQTKVLERYPLKRLAELLKQVDLVIGADTGPVHLAAAVGTPTVSFYRASDGSESGPRGKRHAIVQAPMECTRCFKTSCDRDDECRHSIAPVSLFNAAIKVLPHE